MRTRPGRFPAAAASSRSGCDSVSLFPCWPSRAQAFRPHRPASAALRFFPAAGCRKNRSLQFPETCVANGRAALWGETHAPASPSTPAPGSRSHVHALRRRASAVARPTNRQTLAPAPPMRRPDNSGWPWPATRTSPGSRPTRVARGRRNATQSRHNAATCARSRLVGWPGWKAAGTPATTSARQEQELQPFQICYSYNISCQGRSYLAD